MDIAPGIRTIEFNTPIYCALVDYKGAFDGLNLVKLDRILKLFLSPSMVKRVLSLYFEAKAMEVINGTTGPEFGLVLRVPHFTSRKLV